MIIGFTHASLILHGIFWSDQIELFRQPRESFVDSIIIINTRDSLRNHDFQVNRIAGDLPDWHRLFLAVPTQLRYRNFFRFPARR